MPSKLSSLPKKSAKINRERGKRFINLLIYPPKKLILAAVPLSFAFVIFILYKGVTESAAAYAAYLLSAYFLTVLIAAVPEFIEKIKAVIKNGHIISKIRRSEFADRYLKDRAFRAGTALLRGAVTDFCYAVFRTAVGIGYASVWFISLAIYYLVLGCIRAYLFMCFCKRSPETEFICYRNTAWLIFLLNITVGGIVFLAVMKNSGFVYPGYIIYVSAAYTFFVTASSVVNTVKYRKAGSPILSAAKVLELIAALVSMLGLQTAMIARFSEENGEFRRVMNTVFGGVLYGSIIAVAVFMLLKERRQRKKEVLTVE